MKMGDKAIVEVNYFFRVFRYRFSIRVGGYPRGRVIENTAQNHLEDYVDTSCYCRSSKAGGIAAFIDADAFDRNYAEKLGVDIENLIISQPDNGEQALEIAENLIRSGAIDIVVIDSVAFDSKRDRR
jgi:recombination protein RecA